MARELKTFRYECGNWMQRARGLEYITETGTVEAYSKTEAKKKARNVSES